jgi:predicted nucleotidyltransferase
MNDAIAAAIAAIENEHEVRVLYAAESGSRAWGFASPDSDYDVRFIYVHQRDFYLGISEPRDVIEAMLPGDLDLAGWDLRKTLRLFLRGNYALNEWLDSSIVYAERGGLAAGLRQMLPAAFRVPGGYHHYLRMAQGVHGEHLADDPVRLKKVFYVLRPLLACRWIRQTGEQPPTAFERLVATAWVSADERAMIHELEIAKAAAREADRAPLAAGVRIWLQGELEAALEASALLRSTASLTTDQLDRLMIDCLAEAWA